ncbi:hypothetical protein OIE62_23115 [Streptomyces scopuliridis]|uniref:Uncharacterized protein n=1 Tax=Streptomyces scopuliridis TaxID=452529 RepID=A0ACD4ZJP5_9ACTN|nr:hypothetical protein [Streptomyces scopuliridis]WSB98702.1 hypothetical protein OG835_17830 [Streptomyces scopuliridis]WSC07595.1 hypothetical protein OIE62_23115 [Streptomyces scopuliridis]
MSAQPILAALRSFHCEHTPSKSRILALIDHREGPASLQAVLTCRQPELAQQAVGILHHAIRSSTDAWEPEPLEELCAQLPDAPASSLRSAATHALAGVWPVSSGTYLRWEQIADEVDEGRGEDSDAEVVTRALRTPADARLTDLQGLVIRLEVLREFHVHDQRAVLKAARSAGWEPLPDDDLKDDDPQDIVGAVMWLGDSDGEIEGADTVTDTCQGMKLRIGSGHEVADWSEEPVVADFGSGWRHKAVLRRGEPAKPPAEEKIPDFAVLFKAQPPHCEDPECEDERCQWQLTPRTADLLHTELCVLADQAYDDCEELGDRPVVPDEREGHWGVFTNLPKLTFAADLQWRRRFARAADDLAADLERGQWPEPTCTAEELALHLAIRDASDRGDEDHATGRHGRLPAHRDDYDFDMCSEIFFQDSDVLMLYSARFDGIEDPDGETNQYMGIGDLRASAWFEPFLNVTARAPHRGFRR